MPAKPPAPGLRLDAGTAAGWHPSDQLISSLARLLLNLARGEQTAPSPAAIRRPARGRRKGWTGER